MGKDLRDDLALGNGDFYSFLFMHANDAIYLADPETSTILECNEKAAEMDGFSREELIGKRVKDLHPPEEQERLPETLKEINRQGSLANIQGYHHLRGDGTLISVEVSAALITFAGRKLNLSIVRDVTERESSQAVSSRLAAIVESSEDAIFSKDLDGTITSWNKAAADMYGYTASEAIGQSVCFLSADGCEEEVRDILARIARGEKVEHFETVRVTRDGRQINVSLSVSPVRDPGGNVVGASTIARDITQHIQAEQELREAHQLLETIFEHTHMMVAYLDADFNFIRVNRAYAESDGHEPDYYTGKNHFDLFPNEENRQIFERVVATGQTHFAVAKVFAYAEHPERGATYWDWSLVPVRDSEDKIIGVVMTLLDVTDRMRVSEELKRALAYNRSLIEASLDPLVTISPGGKITDVNAATEEVTGRSRDELIGTDFSDYFTAPNKARSGYRQVFDEGTVHDFALEIRHRDGHITPVLYNASLYRDEAGEVIGVFAAARNITEKKLAEEKIIRSEKMLLEAQQIAHLGHWDLDLATNRLYWSDEVYRIFGLEPQEFGATYEAFLEHVHPDDRDFVDNAYTDSIKNHSGYDIEHRVLLKNGEVKFVNERCYTEFDRIGDPVRSIGTVLDITDRKRAEERLKLALAYNRSLIEASLDPLVTISPGGKITDVNAATENITGHTRDDLIGTDFSDYFTAPEKARAGYRQVFEEGMVHDYALEIRQHNGFSIPVLYNASVYRDEAGEVIGVFAAARDITERLKLEEQLYRAQRLESVGRLAGGIAHDFNNFLTAIRGYIDLARLEVPGESEAADDLSEAARSADRAAGLTRQLLIFSRRESMDLKPVDLNTILRDMIKMLSKLIGENYEIVTSLESSLARMNADAGHIEQVIMNLVVNARDSMGAGGEIFIDTDNMAIDREQAVELDVEPGQYVCLSVKDTGCGMDEETQSHIFEPFYSNKPGVDSTGLGLSLVYGIVRQHGGWIEVESAVDRGTEFRVIFPAIATLADVDEQEVAGAGFGKGNGERVLLVEDEESVRRFASNVLSRNGYKVVEAGNAEDAMRVYEEQPDSFDLVFCDVVLPGEDGLWLAEQLAAKEPQLAVVLASGYNQPQEQAAIRKKGLQFLPKPYSMNQLLQMTGEVVKKKS